jgi:catechol 2,3-dioxygenase-like lactoylglutathione lyase family enzyme
MKPTIAHIGIAVPDVDAALRFYRDVLQVPTRGPEEADGAKIVHLSSAIPRSNSSSRSTRTRPLAAS